MKGKKGREIAVASGAPEPAASVATADRAGNRRGSPRTDTGYTAAYNIRSVSYAVDVRDISSTGARIRIQRGMLPTVGQLIALILPGRPGFDAEVVWSRGEFVGVKFTEPLVDFGDAIHFEDLGADYFRALVKFQHLRG